MTNVTLTNQTSKEIFNVTKVLELIRPLRVK